MIGDERGDLLDLDVVLWYPKAKPDIEAHPMYQSLDLANEGRRIWLDDPVLEAALDGDPDTTAG